ncbi:MAG: nitroreductase family protein [candidate division FCPU426 bacterium]
MRTKEPITSVIRRRKSWRTFLNRPLSAQVRERINRLLSEELQAPFPGSWRFHLKDYKPAGGQTPVRLGTYGTIAGARHFVIGAVSEGAFDLVNYGYLMERIILELTSLGLGTCWLGATFDHRSFAALISARPDELVPAVTPVGEMSPRRGLNGHIMDLYATAHTRKPWQERFFLGGFSRPLLPAEAGLYAEPLEMVRIAPSASNRQPWRIVRDARAGVYHFYLRRNPVYIGLIHAAFKAHDLQQLDLGIAMCHFELTAREFGLSGSWVVADPGLKPLPKLTDYFVTWAG